MARLPILMYHNVSNEETKSIDLTISTTKLEQHLQYIVSNKYISLFASEIENIKDLQAKNIVITFDDVTENQMLYALPLLQKYHVKATFFIPFNYIGKTDLWNYSPNVIGEKIMSIEQLKSLDAEIIELGHHSCFHKQYTNLTAEEIQLDFDKSYEIITKNNLKVYPSLAYPYGNYPKKGIQKIQFFDLLKKNNIKMAFRIGNRVNSFPFKNKFEIQRIDIKGQYSMIYFKWKVRWGKLRLF